MFTRRPRTPRISALIPVPMTSTYRVRAGTGRPDPLNPATTTETMTWWQWRGGAYRIRHHTGGGDQ